MVRLGESVELNNKTGSQNTVIGKDAGRSSGKRRKAEIELLINDNKIYQLLTMYFTTLSQMDSFLAHKDIVKERYKVHNYKGASILKRRKKTHGVKRV